MMLNYGWVFMFQLFLKLQAFELLIEEFTENSFDSLGEWTLQNYNNVEITSCKDTDGLTKSFVGGFESAGRIQGVDKTRTTASRYIVLPPHYQLKVEYKVIRIDNHAPLMSIENDFDEISQSASTITQDFCGNPTDDNLEIYSLEFDHKYSTLFITIHSIVDVFVEEGSWGFREFRLYIERCPADCIFCDDNISANCNMWRIYGTFWYDQQLNNFSMDGWSSTATLEAGYCGSINFLQKLREYDEITRTFTSLPPHDTVNIFVRIIGSNGFGGSQFSIIVDGDSRFIVWGIHYKRRPQICTFFLPEDDEFTWFQQPHYPADRNFYTHSSDTMTVEFKVIFQNSVHYWSIREIQISLAYTQNCHYSCLTCSGTTEFDCLSCNTEFAQRQLTTTNECKCIDETIDEPMNSICQVNQDKDKCHQSCASCSGPAHNECLSCKSSDFRDFDDNINQCQCIEGTFDDNIQSACQSCHSLCLTCTGSHISQCLSCEGNNLSVPLIDKNLRTSYDPFTEIILSATISGLECKGTSQNLGQVKFQWKVFMIDKTTQQQILIEESQQQQYKDQEVYHTIGPFKLNPEEKYLVQLQSYYENDPIVVTSDELELNVEKVDKIVQIIGGNRKIGQNTGFQIKAEYFNFNNQFEPIEDLSSVVIDWQCINIATQTQCQDQSGNPLIFDQTSLIQNIPAQTFQLLESYKFTIKISEDTNNVEDEVIISIIDEDIQLFSLMTSNELGARLINLYEEIELIFDYVGNPDDFIFQLNFYYGMTLLKTQKMESNKIKVKFWDFLGNIAFEKDNNEILVKSSIFNVKYTIPATSTKRFKINIPPQNCKIEITPFSGVELQDNYEIRVDECQDNHLPLLYKFGFYESEADLAYDINNGQSLRLQQYTEYAITPVFKSVLGCINLENSQLNCNIPLYIQVQDSKGGLTNITYALQIQQQDTLDSTILKQMVDSLTKQDQQLRIYPLVLNRIKGIQADQGITEIKQSIFSSLSAMQGLNPESQYQISQQLAMVMGESDVVLDSIKLTDLDQSTQIIQEQLINLASKQFTSNNKLFYQLKIENNKKSLHQITSSASSLLRQLEQSKNEEEQKSNYQELINLMEKITKNMLIGSLPNEPPKIIVTQQIKTLSAFTTIRMLEDFLGNIYNRKINNFNDGNRVLEQETDHYSSRIVQYETNPYRLEDDYEYKNQSFGAVSYSVTHQDGINYEIEKDNDNNKAQLENGIDIQIKINEKQDNSTVSCISKESDNWSFDDCQTQLQQDNLTAICECSSFGVATIVEDFTELFPTQRQEQILEYNDIFNMEWRSTHIFYIFTGLTGFAILYGILAKYLDHRDEIKVFPLILQNQEENLNLQKSSKDITYNKDFTYNKDSTEKNNLTSNKDLISSKDLQSRKHLTDNKEINENKDNDAQVEDRKIDEDEQLNQIMRNSQSSIKKERRDVRERSQMKNSLTLIKESTNLQKDNSLPSQSSFKNLFKKYDTIKQDQVIDSKDQASISKAYIQNENNQEEQKQSQPQKQKKSLGQFIKENFSYTNILYVYDGRFSRTMRCAILYESFLIDLATTVYFGEELNFIQVLMVIGISGLANIVILTLLTKLLKMPYFCFQLIGFLLFMAFSLFFIYLSAVLIAQTGSVIQANQWAIQYGITFSCENFLIQFFEILLKFKLAEKYSEGSANCCIEVLVYCCLQ